MDNAKVKRLESELVTMRSSIAKMEKELAEEKSKSKIENLSFRILYGEITTNLEDPESSTSYLMVNGRRISFEGASYLIPILQKYIARSSDKNMKKTWDSVQKFRA